MSQPSNSVVVSIYSPGRELFGGSGDRVGLMSVDDDGTVRVVADDGEQVFGSARDGGHLVRVVDDHITTRRRMQLHAQLRTAGFATDRDSAGAINWP